VSVRRPRLGVPRRVDVDPSIHEYDVLLPGEAQSMAEPTKRDVEHWIGVYAQLCEFKEMILAAVSEQRDKVHLQGRIEVDHDDMVFRREHERLRRRLQYWQRMSAARK
jgi:hypothetical protein